MKTHFKKLRNPNFIGSWDLENPTQDGYITKDVTITKVENQQVHDGKGGQSECTVVVLAECKPLIANSTNIKAIAKVLKTPYIEDWIGQKITLTVKQVKAFGEVHDAIRVAMHAPKQAVKPVIVAGSEAWGQAITYLRNGGKIEAITKKYSLDTAAIELLQTAADEPA